MTMISAVSKQIVTDLGKGSLCAINGIPESTTIRPFTIVLEKKPSWWKFWQSKQYLVNNFCISDILSDNVDLQDVEVKSSKIAEYSSDTDSTIDVKGKLSLEALKKFPELKANGDVNLKLVMKIKSGEFSMKTVNESVFEKKMRGRYVNREHSFIQSCFGKSRYRFGVIIEILEANQTEIDFTSTVDVTVKGSGKKGESDGSADVKVKKSNTNTLKLEAGTVLACRWRPFSCDATGKIFWDYSEKSPDGDIVVQGTVEGNQYDEDMLSDLKSANDDEIRSFQTAINSVMESSSDIEALLNLFADKSADEKTFRSQLQKNEAVMMLLKLIGYELQDNNIVITNDGPFQHLIPVVVQSIEEFDSEDLKVIRKVNACQKRELISIIKAAMANHVQTTIEIDSKFKSELQQEPVEHVFAVMDFSIDLLNGNVLPPPRRTCKLEAMFFLLSCL